MRKAGRLEPPDGITLFFKCELITFDRTDKEGENKHRKA